MFDQRVVCVLTHCSKTYFATAAKFRTAVISMKHPVLNFIHLTRVTVCTTIQIHPVVRRVFEPQGELSSRVTIQLFWRNLLLVKMLIEFK